MIPRLLPFVVGLTLAGCITATPASSMADCKGMADMHKDGAQASAMPDDMMKHCPMMKDKAAPEPPKDEAHGDGPEHQH